MLELSVLASSSKGNASVLRSPQCTLLIDAGISARRICKGLEACELHPKNLDGVLFTHEHKDHCLGIGQLSKKHDLQIYCSRHTAADIRPMAPSAAFHYMQPEQSFWIKDICITPFSIQHDASDPLAVLFEHSSGTRFAYVTDTGHVTASMLKHLEGLHGFYLESNYCPQLLEASNRPYSLVSRIASRWGHLSNQQAGELIQSVASPKLQHLILGHLSQDCNTPDVAHAAMQAVLTQMNLKTRLQCAPAAHRLDWVLMEEQGV